MNFKDNGKKCRKQTFDVYVGHVPKVVTEETLRNLFLKHGEVSDVLCRHSNTSQLGFAIVKFKNKNDVDKLLKNTEAVYSDGYRMEVKMGKKNSQGTENGDGTHNKTATSSEPVSHISHQMSNVHMIGTNLHVWDGNSMLSAHCEMNGQQMQVEIICMYVQNSTTFYGCLVQMYGNLEKLRLELSLICPNLVRLNRKPSLNNRKYAAMYGGHWYRCVVRDFNQSGMCIVEYIDYGNIENVPYTNLVDLPEYFQTDRFSAKCVLSNLRCNPNYINDSYLHSLVNKRMTLSAIALPDPTCGVPVYKVHKCSSNGIDVVNELLRIGHVCRTQLSSKSSPPLHKSENPGCSKENHKPKKGSTNKTHPKKVTTKELCNGVEKSEGMNSTVNDAVKNPKSSSCDDSQHTENIVPKKIMKRGSDISDLAPVPVLEGSETVNHYLKMDQVLANLKLVNNIRNLVSFPADNSLIDKAVRMLMNEETLTVSQDQKSLLESAHKKYSEVLNNIKNCTDQKLLSDLKDRRDRDKNELLNVLKQFLESSGSSLCTQRKEIQELITALESNSTAWMNVHMASLPDNIENLVAEYHKERKFRWSIIQKSRKNTDEKYKKFHGDFIKEFSLNMLNDESVNGSCHLENNGGKKGSYALKFEKSLNDLGIALEEEMKACSVTKGKSHVDINKFIVEKLDVPKERIDNEYEFYMKYKSLYDDLKKTSDLSSLFEKLSAAQKNIQALTLDCVDDKEKLPNRLAELHSNLLSEDKCLERLAKVSTVHFPELILEYPELNLREYENTGFLLKSKWHKGYFPVLENCNRLEPSYISITAEGPIVIKEFNVGCESEKKDLLKKARLWNEISSQSLVKIKALFNKDKIGVFVMFPQIWETLCENPLPVPVDNRVACSILQQVLKGLFDIHEKGMAHGAVHPLAVLHQDGKVLLDFNYDRKFVQDNVFLKGINFQDPSGEDLYKSTDMYGFGCLVLWVLFPNLSFTSANDGGPNILAFQSIIQELLSSNDFTDLSNLLKPMHHLRPTSKDLYKKGFLKNLRTITKCS